MTQKEESVTRRGPAISLDTWAVGLALALAMLIRMGFIPRVPW